MKSFQDASTRLFPVEDWVVRAACPACASTDNAVLRSRTAYRFAEWFPAGRVSLPPVIERERRLLRCRQCDIWYFSHVPTTEMLAALHDAPAGFPPRWSSADRPAFMRARESLRSLFPEGADVLDIGGYAGGFAATLPGSMRKTVLDPFVSPGADPIAGVSVIRSPVESFATQDAFDCVTAFDVLEHLLDPRDAIRRLGASLRPGGILVIETGVNSAFFARTLKAGWYYLSYLEHFQVLSAGSIRSLFADNGLRMFSMERVRHDPAGPSAVLRAWARVLPFLSATLGTNPWAWRALYRAFRPASEASPPSTACLERDHVYAVARKPA